MSKHPCRHPETALREATIEDVTFKWCHKCNDGFTEMEEARIVAGRRPEPIEEDIEIVDPTVEIGQTL